ncbi:zinc finger protein ZPR1 isoform X6 [Erythrolamprus reginae]|uniref:zinc finger protein ZPR1 isoform X6 n=1 Tax=Erythrolamprus reginae TaxID=121349 RepID=UPI00396CA4E2
MAAGPGVAGPARLFCPLSADEEEQLPTELESLCMACFRRGATRLLLTSIPFFREVVVGSFACGSCGWSNAELQSAGRIQARGVRYTLAVRSPQDLNRAVVKTDSAAAAIPELDFEIPAFSQKGVFTTLEGILDRAIAGLEQDQPDRRILDDPSGNSFLENPRAPQKDDALEVTHYRRTAQQAALLGLEEEGVEDESADSAEDLRNEVLQFNTNCPECNAPASTNMKLVQIPHFKEVVIMATTCDACGHRTNESETCMVEIPELEFELGMGALGGKFTTLEGLLKDIQALVEKNPFTLGDGSCPDKAAKLQAFGRKLQQIVDGHMEVHLVLDDPAGNSYLQNLYAPEEDPELCMERYERRFEQNEELGLNDMKTEGYEAQASPAQRPS